MLATSLALFFFSAHFFIPNSQKFSFNAFSTTFLQTTLGLLSSGIGYGFCIDRVFFPTSRAFWKLKAYSYFGSAAVLHGISSALNISLMWIEISSFRQLKIVQNVHRTKNILLGIIVSLYIELLVFGVIVAAYRILQGIALFYVFFLVATFWFGASRMHKLLNPTHSETYTEQLRATKNNDEITRIFSTTKIVCFFSVAFLLGEVTYLLTFHLRIPTISCFAFHGFQFCMLCLNFAIIVHLQGRTLLPWDFLSCFKSTIDKMASTPSSQSYKNDRIVPLNEECSYH